ncbi:conserved exported hypothetical protein [Paraburkholderia unamae]|uniref:type II secretion system protein GspD n=1 Tax=Paraburkholderia unamae TaxID=219649 RepID=UPI001CADA222|nr:hypothetical protein [Paraburkholderia unamae]CAG9255269.1 conserved exported hypothetical protein [Paraburkholderia unamae]
MKPVAKRTKFLLKPGCVALSVALAACTVAQKEQIDASGRDLGAHVERHMASTMPGKATVVSRVRGNWLAPKIVSLGEDSTLPPQFSNARSWPFQLGYLERSDLPTVAERISKITGIPVRLNPDVNETAADSGAGAPDTGHATTGGNLPPPPSRPGMGTGGAAIPLRTETMELNYNGSLGDFLNRVATHFGVNWEYRDGAIQFYRYVTRMWQINTNSGDTEFNEVLGKSSGSTSQSGGGGGSGSSGSGSSSGGSSFTSAGQVTVTGKFSVWKSIEEELNTVKSASGKLTISQATGTVVMRDTRDAIEAADRIVKHENRVMTQQVVVHIDLISVTTSDDSNLGVNWNVVFSKLTNALPDFTLSMASPASLVSSGTGSLGAAILAPATAGSQNIYQQMSGSSLLLQALKGVGRVNDVNSAAAVTLNRHLGTLASTDQKTYLAQTSPGYSSSVGGGSGLPGLTPGQVTTGLIGHVLPTVLDDGSILLNLNLDNSVLKSLGQISTGSGATQQTIETPEVNGFTSMPQVALKPGATLVLAGLTHDSQNYSQQTLLGHAVGLGGSYSGTREKVTVVILVTAQLLPGG